MSIDGYTTFFFFLAMFIKGNNLYDCFFAFLNVGTQDGR